MTTEQAKAALGDEAEVISEEAQRAQGWSLRVPRYELLNDRSFRVRLGFGAEKGLQIVEIRSEYPNEALARIVNEGAARYEAGKLSKRESKEWLLADDRCKTLDRATFDVLATRLTEKYGPPSERKRTSLGPTATWTLTHTVISLSAEMGVSLIYRPRSSGNDKL